jgi:hypothetical protein
VDNWSKIPSAWYEKEGAMYKKYREYINSATDVCSTLTGGDTTATLKEIEATSKKIVTATETTYVNSQCVYRVIHSDGVTFIWRIM